MLELLRARCLAWACAVLAVGCVLLAVAVRIRGGQLARAQEALRLAQAQAAQLQAGIAAQNQAVAAWQAQGQAQTEQVKAASSRALAVRRASEATAQAILTAAPPAGGCEAAARWGIENAATLAREWEQP
jgi:hypothetical protein